MVGYSSAESWKKLPLKGGKWAFVVVLKVLNSFAYPFLITVHAAVICYCWL